MNSSKFPSTPTIPGWTEGEREGRKERGERKAVEEEGRKKERQ
jgi:hypothetical protein